MQGASLYCVIIGGAFLAAALFAIGTITVMYIADKWSKRDDPGAPGFLELDKRGREKDEGDKRKDGEE